MKVWISKFAFSKGIYELDVEPSLTSPSMVVCKYANSFPEYFHGEGKEWHRTRDSAVRKAEEMRTRKIAALKRQLSKLEKLSFV